MRLRIFYIQYALSKREEERAFEHNRKCPIEGQVEIRYSKRRKIIEMDLESERDAYEWAREQEQMVSWHHAIRRRFNLIFAVCEARDGKKVTELEEAFTATEVLLPLE